MTVLRISDEASAIVAQALAGEDEPERLSLWVEVTGTRGSSYAYDMFFSDASEAEDGDFVGESNGISVVVPKDSIDALKGAVLEVSGEGEESGLVMVNPNSPPAPNLPPGLDPEKTNLDSDLARRVMAVLAEQVNPSIASHGGQAELIAVSLGDFAAGVSSESSGEAGEGAVGAGSGAVAFLRLSGGCQGCGMARATLSQGIEVAIRDAVPEIVGVVDVTDHASGLNPFFAPA